MSFASDLLKFKKLVMNTTGIAAAGGAISLREKLQRASQAAAVSNPVTAAPWLVPPAYSASTAYAVGQVVSNGGNWYMCGIAGTSPSSGTGPTTTTSGQYIQDATSGLYWTYLGGAQIAASDPQAPAVSLVTSNPFLAQSYLPLYFPNRFRIFGAYPTALRTNLWELKAFNYVSGAATCCGAAVGFGTDSAKVAIQLPSNGAQYRVIVDGRYLTPSGYVIGGSDSWAIIDWTSSSGKRPRTYRVETNKSVSYFGGVSVLADASVWAEEDAAAIKSVYLSDSYGAGSNYGPFLGGGSLPAQVGKLLGIADMWNMSTGGTGDIATNGGAAYSFAQRIADTANKATIAAADVIFMQGSTNDQGSTQTAITAARLANLQALRAANPVAAIIVVGVPSINLTSVTSNAAQIEAAVQSAVSTFNDRRTTFIPLATDTPPWVMGTWNNTSTPGATAGSTGGGNNAGFYIGGDNIHPPEIGTGYYARRIANAVRTLVIPNLT